ncbi:MAG TPA: hypothetical protein PLG90_10940 [Ignavibacteria bacterium]|nr:hypothetical protein [Ignavibacteria bacterium]
MRIKIIILIFLIFKNCYSSDTVEISKENFPKSILYSPNYHESEIFEDNGTFFKGYLVIELDTTLNKPFSVFWVKTLKNFENQNKYFQPNAFEMFKNLALIDYSLNKINKLNCFIFNFYLLKKVNFNAFNNVHSVLTNEQLLTWINNKNLYFKNKFYYIIYSVYFHTIFINEKTKDSIYILPISEFYNFEQCTENTLTELEFVKTKFLRILN